jgi:hypothetical protein
LNLRVRGVSRVQCVVSSFNFVELLIEVLNRVFNEERNVDEIPSLPLRESLFEDSRLIGFVVRIDVVMRAIEFNENFPTWDGKIVMEDIEVFFNEVETQNFEMTSQRLKNVFVC